jgi:hypothetical protein
MTSRMRETGMELAIEEAGAGPLPDRGLVSRGRNGLPPLPVCPVLWVELSMKASLLVISPMSDGP